MTNLLPTVRPLSYSISEIDSYLRIQEYWMQVWSYFYMSERGRLLPNVFNRPSGYDYETMMYQYLFFLAEAGEI